MFLLSTNKDCFCTVNYGASKEYIWVGNWVEPEIKPIKKVNDSSVPKTGISTILDCFSAYHDLVKVPFADSENKFVHRTYPFGI